MKQKRAMDFTARFSVYSHRCLFRPFRSDQRHREYLELRNVLVR